MAFGPIANESADRAVDALVGAPHVVARLADLGTTATADDHADAQS
jgi:hypothetical protein